MSYSHLYSSLFICLSLPSPFALKNPFLRTKLPDIPKSLREMPESISWVIISVQSDTLSSGIICSQALWRPVVMPEISWHVINCEWLTEEKHKIVCFVLDSTAAHVRRNTLTAWRVFQDTCNHSSASHPVHLPACASLLRLRSLSPQGSIEVLNCKQPG